MKGILHNLSRLTANCGSHPHPTVFRSSAINSSKMTPSLLSFLACLLLGTASVCQAQASASAFASVSTVCLCRGCQYVSSSLPAWCALGLGDGEH